ncbi:hypothetical protein P43SY_010688 [Pythium insidiosum]|uniref:Uncharacterized protein n=1 Tax=Pythium insidiosum TaxID=114742 RepID=A0AAD5LT89_PYTIN|nr:hypothetical protein P43SY_010688 [Pythium insidiosum]
MYFRKFRYFGHFRHFRYFRYFRYFGYFWIHEDDVAAMAKFYKVKKKLEAFTSTRVHPFDAFYSTSPPISKLCD